MFDDSMQFKDGEELYPLHLWAAGSEPLPLVFQLWMAELSRDVLRLGVYFRTVAIMLQIPGASEYGFVDTDGDLGDLIRASDQNELLNVLATCLERLGVADLMKQVPAPDYYTEELCEAWQEWLDNQEEVKNGLLNVVAECLDELVIKPGHAEIQKANELSWWQRRVPERQH